MSRLTDYLNVLTESCHCVAHPNGCPGEDCDGCDECITGELRRIFAAEEKI